MAALDYTIEITPEMIREAITPVLGHMVDVVCDPCTGLPDNPMGLSSWGLVRVAFRFAWKTWRLFRKNKIPVPWRQLGRLILDCANTRV